MDTIVISLFAAFILIAFALAKLGEDRGWGVAPLGFLGLGFIVPIAMLLIGFL